MSMIINNVFISDEAYIKALLYFPNNFFFYKVMASFWDKRMRWISTTGNIWLLEMHDAFITYYS